MNNYIDLSRLTISSQDEDNTYFGLDENGNIVRTKIAVGGDGGSGFVDLSDYYTKSEVDKKIDDIETGDVDLSNYYTKQEINNKGYVTDSDVNEYVGNEIEQLEELIKTKQNKLVSGSNIKTINGQSLVGSGNITIVGGDGDVDLSGYYTKGEVNDIVANIEIPEVDLSGYYTKGEVNDIVANIEIPEVDLTKYYTKTQVDAINIQTTQWVEEYVGEEKNDLLTQIGKKQNKLVSGSNIKTINGETILGGGDIEITVPEVDLSNYYTKKQVDDKISGIDLTEYAKTEDLTPIQQDITGLVATIQQKQDTLVSGTNIKTINGVSVLGSGDIAIEAGGDVDLSNYFTKKDLIPTIQKVTELTADVEILKDEVSDINTILESI